MIYAPKFEEKEEEATTEYPEHCSTFYTFVPTVKHLYNPAETGNYLL